MFRQIDDGSHEWRKVLREKMSELELIASWASMTNFGRVRDSCREAKDVLRQEIKRLEDEHKEYMSNVGK